MSYVEHSKSSLDYVLQVLVLGVQHAVGALPFCGPVAAIIGGIYSRASQVCVMVWCGDAGAGERRGMRLCGWQALKMPPVCDCHPARWSDAHCTCIQDAAITGPP